jgi:DNA-binding transcriptional LysR family regulator
MGAARTRSFSRAAAEAGLTPQAVSKAVRQLEEHLGVRLFHRTTRSLSLTEEGSRLFELANPGLRLLDEAMDQVRNSRQEADGLIRLAAPQSIGTTLLIPLLTEFQHRYPGVYFDVQLDDHFVDLVENKIDVGFRAGTPPERNLVSRKLGDIPLLVCASPLYLERHGKPKNADALRQHRCTGFRQPNTGKLVPWELHIGGETVFQEIPAVASFNTVQGELEAVRAGVGIGQMPLYMIQRDLAEGTLVHLLPKQTSALRGVYMYYPQRTQMPLRVRHFIDYIAGAAPAFFSAASTPRLSAGV